MSKNTSLPILIAFLLVAYNANATTMNYEVSGNAIDDDHNFIITGNIFIDDTLRKWPSLEPAPREVPDGQYSYYVSQYSLTFTDIINASRPEVYSFSQTYKNNPTEGIYLEKGVFNDIQFNLSTTSDSLGNSFNCGWGWTVFLNEDYTRWLYSDYFNNLPTIIIINDALALHTNDGQDIYFTKSSMVLQQTGPANDTAPVPEPATMLLFGTGLVGLAGTRMRKNK